VPQFPFSDVPLGKLYTVWGTCDAQSRGLPALLLLQALLSVLQAKRDAWRTMKYMELFIVADHTLVSAVGGRNRVPCRKARTPLCLSPCFSSGDPSPSPSLCSTGTRTSTWATPSSASWRSQTTWTR